MATRRGSGGRAILAAIERIAAACEACSPWWSNTIRTARARTSGEYGGMRLVMAPSFQDQEPPENPVRFTRTQRFRVEWSTSRPRSSQPGGDRHRPPACLDLDEADGDWTSSAGG